MRIKKRYWPNLNHFLSKGYCGFSTATTGPPARSHVCSEGYVPYGWQFSDEEGFIVAQKGFRLNCWGLISRDNECHWQTTTRNINARFVWKKLDAFSFGLRMPTVVVLDNASVHRAKLIQNSRSIWEQRAGPPVRSVFIFSAPLQSSLEHS